MLFGEHEIHTDTYVLRTCVHLHLHSCFEVRGSLDLEERPPSHLAPELPFMFAVRIPFLLSCVLACGDIGEGHAAAFGLSEKLPVMHVAAQA